MNIKQAINVFFQGIDIAQNKGAFELEDAAILYQARLVLEQEFFPKEETDKENSDQLNKENDQSELADDENK